MSESDFASLGPSLLARKGSAKPAMRPQVAPLVADQAAVAEEQFEDLGWNDMGGADNAGSVHIVPILNDLSVDAMVANLGPVVRRQQRGLEERLLADAAMVGPESYEAEEDAGEDYAEEDYAEDDYAGEDYESEDHPDGPLYGEDHGNPEEPEVAEATGYAPLAPEPVTVPAARASSPAKTRARALPSGRRAAFTLRLDADRHLKLRLAATMQGVSAQTLVTEALDQLLGDFEELDIIANHLKRH
ncbi:MAG: hypothetical protein ACKO1N_06825 [Erythrobacter sp.]